MSCFIYETQDVSSKSATLKSDGVVKLAATLDLNQLFGDPAPLVPKNLHISFGDGTKITLPEERQLDVSISAKRPLEIVVARYNETLDWINDYEIFKKHCYTIYNKGPNQNFVQKRGNVIVPVENIGRNDHTYLYHIIQNYGCLADVTLFLPGSLQMPFKFIEGVALLRKICETGKAWMFATHCDDLCAHFKDFTLDRWVCSAQPNRNINNEELLTPAETRPLGNWYRKHYGTQLTQNFFFHGIFSVDRETILKRPLSFYQDILRQLSVSSNPEVGHYTERTWHAMFPGTSIISLPPNSAFLYENVLWPQKLVFCSSDDRFCWQARQSGYFDQVEKKDVGLKPLIVQQMLSTIKDGELLCFCHRNLTQQGQGAVEIFKAILSGSDYDNVVFKTNRNEGDFTKMDVLRWFPNAEYTSKQYTSAYFILKKTREIVQLVDEWLRMAQRERNVENFPSFEDNVPTFVKHDSESVFSLLIKQHNKSFVVENHETLFY